jgi:hypothetical protein
MALGALASGPAAAATQLDDDALAALTLAAALALAPASLALAPAAAAAETSAATAAETSAGVLAVAVVADAFVALGVCLTLRPGHARGAGVRLALGRHA